MQIKIIYIGRIRNRTYDKNFRRYIEWISQDAKLEIIALKENHSGRVINQIDNLKKDNHFNLKLMLIRNNIINRNS